MRKRRGFLTLIAAVSLSCSGLCALPAYAESSPAPQGPAAYHPSADGLWATSSEPFESTKTRPDGASAAPNGTVAALIDDDPELVRAADGRTVTNAANVTFWNTHWKVDRSRGEQPDPFPHALVMNARNPEEKLCAIRYTGRPWTMSGKDHGGEVRGGDNNPGHYVIYGFTTPPAQITAENLATWRDQVRTAPDRLTGLWEGGVKVADGHIPAPAEGDINTIITHDLALNETSGYTSYAVVGLEAVSPSKAGMSASDIKLQPCPPEPKPAHKEAGGPDNIVRDIVMDQLPFGEPGAPVRFSSDVHSYTAAAYYHSTTAGVRVIAAEGATVTVNGVAVDGDGRVKGLKLKEGDNVLEVVATKDGREAVYVIHLTKVTTDFRGNVKLHATMAANGANAEQNAALVDGDRTTTYVTDPAIQSAEWSESATGFTLTLDRVSAVHRLNIFMERIDEAVPAGEDPKVNQTRWWDGGSAVAVAISPDETGDNWTIVGDSGDLRTDTKGLRYFDFNRYYQTKRIRVWLPDTAASSIHRKTLFRGVSWQDFEVWGLAEGQTEPAAPTTFPHKARFNGFDPGEGKWGVNRAQSLALQYGINTPAWTPSSGSLRGVMNANEQEAAGGLIIPQFYEGAFFNKELMDSLGEGAPWGLAKFPAHALDTGNSAGDPGDHVAADPDMNAWRSSLVEYQIGDEESLPGNGEKKEALLSRLTDWVAAAKTHYPGAIVHNNQALGTGWNLRELKSYADRVQPDLLSFDVYPYNSRGQIPGRARSYQSSTNQITRAGALVSQIWKDQREAALEHTVDGKSSPLLYGQYIDYNFDANVSESQKSITPMLSLATGQKWLGLFRMEYNGADFSSIIDPDGAPTTSFYEFSRIFDDVRGYGNYLTALNNTFLYVKPGDYDAQAVGGVPSGYKMGADKDAQDAHAALAAAGVNDVSAVENVGTVNNAKPGDVLVGTFETLPGLEDGKVKEVFGEGASAPHAFMVLNGLVGPTRSPEPELFSRTDSGAYWQTAQTITVSLTKPSEDAVLMRVNPENHYRAEAVEVAPAGERSATGAVRLEASEGDSLNLTVPNLGGGRAELFYWSTADQPDPAATPERPAPDTGTTAPTPAPVPGTPEPEATTPSPSATAPDSSSHAPRPVVTAPAPTPPAPGASTTPGTVPPSPTTPQPAAAPAESQPSARGSEAPAPSASSPSSPPSDAARADASKPASATHSADRTGDESAAPGGARLASTGAVAGVSAVVARGLLVAGACVMRARRRTR